MTAEGFTLLETLVAVLLLAFLSLAIATALRLGLAFPALNDPADRIGAVAAAQNFLRRELSAALALPAAQWDGVAFAGSAQAVEFVAPMPARAAAPGLNEVTLYLRNRELTLKWRRLDAPVPKAKATSEKALLKEVAGIGIAYWGSVDGVEDPAWHENWQKAKALPLLVRLRVRFTREREPWPDLVIGLPTLPVPPGPVRE